MSSARYQLSKLLQIFCVRELAARSKASGKSNVIIDCTNPGLCHSELSREGILILEIVKFLLARTTEHGSRSMVNAAASGQETHGTYLSDCRVSK